MVFKWFDTAEVDAFADATVKMFMERFPPSEFTAAGKKQQERFRKVHAALSREMQAFRKKKTLNIYQKARLANRFKWALKDAAYPDAFIDELAYELAAMTALPA
ncbi:MAG: hypothetical protein H7255_10560 [Ramlibacter sp.]|nr:hypothetical protein [Ramlibacter sp.]